MRFLVAAGAGLAIAATMSLLPVSRALACSCAVISEREALDGADVVFEGVALSAREPLIIQSSGDPVEVHLQRREHAQGGPAPRSRSP